MPTLLLCTFHRIFLIPKEPSVLRRYYIPNSRATQKWLRVAGDPRNLMPASPSDGIEFFYQFRVSRPSGANADSSEP